MGKKKEHIRPIASKVSQVVMMQPHSRQCPHGKKI